MKRLVILNILLISTHLLFAQVYKSGTISSPETWSGTVYLSGNVTITSTVTIDAGTRVLFKGNRAIRLVVDGAGSITANGTSGSLIYFSADDDEDGVYGESNERGLKIQFYPSSGSTGSSSFNYCIFEYIDCSNETGGNAYGALDIAGRTVTINNSIIRNNKSDYGGAIFIRSASTFTLSNSILENNAADAWGGAIYSGGSSGLIDRCIIRDNSASSGGGVYVYSGGPTIQNCQIYSNSVTNSGSGIYLNLANSSLKIVNTTCAENTNSITSRDFQFSGNTGQLPKLVNTTIWGSDIGSLDASLITVVNCAIQGVTNVSSHTSSISLSSNNTGDLNSPYFNDPDNFDWSFKFISPLRDEGVNSYPGVTIPSTDYLGNNTIHTKDIGAFEYQYSRWKADAGSTDWATAANWEASLVPGSTSDIVIPSGASLYPTGSSPVDVTVGLGNYFVMEPGSRATINNLTNSGTMQLLASSSAFSSLISTSYVRAGSGTEEIQVFLSGGGTIDDDNFKWHYISSPVASLPTNIFTGNTLDLAQFVESRPTISLRQGWVAYDGYIYSTGGMGGPTFNNLTTATNGKGYNYFHLSDQTYTFSGLLNTRTVTAPLGFSDNGALSGYNLLGNPFLSGLDWNYIINDPGFPLNTTKGLYFTRDNVMCSYINGVGVPGDVTGLIPPMQGFFSKTYTTGNSIVIPVEARTHDNIHSRYKGAETIIPLVRLALAGADLTDETVVRFDAAAKSGLDNDFDAEKFFILETRTYLYTTLGDVKYTINGLPFPETRLEIPVVVNVISDGAHAISATQLQGLDNYRVSLFDQQENITTDLRINPAYTFTAAKGTIANRFVLIFSDLATSSEKIEANSGAFTIFELNRFINIIPQDDLWDGKIGTVNLLDLTGRTIRQVNGTEFRTGSPILVSAPEQKGVFLVEIRSGLQRFTGKVLVK